MALNIAVTSKFDPFTQEDYIKPLANYWKEYEKYEDALFAENAKLAALDPYLSYFTDEDKALEEQYNKYKQSLESAGDQMSQGLNVQTRRQIRGEILPMYGSHIVPIQEAFQKKAAAITEYQKQAAHNPLLLSSQINPLNMSVSSFYGINNGTPGYFTEDGSKIQNEIQQQAASYSSSITRQTQNRQGSTTVISTQTGSTVPRIQFNANGELVIANESEIKPEVADKIRKMYSDGQTIYRYNELDEKSQNKFNRLFIKGIEDGWVNKTTKTTEPYQETYTQVYGGNSFTLTKSDGTQITAQPFTKRDGSVVYLYNGHYYSLDALERMQAKENENKQKQIEETDTMKSNFDKFEQDNLANYYGQQSNTAEVSTKEVAFRARDFKTQKARAKNRSRNNADFITEIIHKYNPSAKTQNMKVAFDAALYAVLDRNFEDMFNADTNEVSFTTSDDYMNIWANDGGSTIGWAITFDGRGVGNLDLHDARFSKTFTFGMLNHKVWGSLEDPEQRIDASQYGKFVAAYVIQHLGVGLEKNTEAKAAKLKETIDYAKSLAKKADGSNVATAEQTTFFEDVKREARKYLQLDGSSEKTSSITGEYTGNTGYNPIAN